VLVSVGGKSQHLAGGIDKRAGQTKEQAEGNDPIDEAKHRLALHNF